MIASAYTSTANVMGFTLGTSAAMLAFFFAFQGALLSGYASLHNGFAGAMWREWHVGKWAITGLCALAIVFTIWSFLVVLIFMRYFDAILSSGEALDAKTNKLTGTYEAMRAAYKQSAAQKYLPVATFVFFAVLLLIWTGLIFVAWAHK